MSPTPSFPETPVLRRALALAQLRHVGCVAFREHVERWGSAAAAFDHLGTPAEREAALAYADALMARAERCHAHMLVFGESHYPERLGDLADPPSTCFAIGRLELLAAPLVAIVGTRRSSEAGERFTHRLAGELVRHGVVVVSGMARGIDAAAHRGALEAGGATIAVLAGGCDTPYPPSHRALHAQIATSGLVLSEAEPGAWGVPGGFLRRNRIIAALGQAVFVIEAGLASGALTTARKAMEIGRAVGAVPGWIDSPRSTGTNTLLVEGASVIADVIDALVMVSRATQAFPLPELARGNGPRRRSRSAPARPVERPRGSDPAAEAVLRALEAGACSIDELADQTGLTARDLGAAIATLEVSGTVWSDHHGAVRLSH